MKKASIVLLAVVIIGALIMGLIRTGVVGGKRMPEDVLHERMRVIDVETLEFVEVSVADWERKFESDAETGYKIDGQKRQLASPISCVSCGESIPSPPISRDMERQERMRIMNQYRCPRCGRHAYEAIPGVPR